MDVGQPHAGVDGEIIDALFALFDQRVLVDLPVEFYGIAVDLLQRLVDRHGADRDRRVAQDPFPRGVDVAPGREVHHGVGAPADRPHHLVDFFLHRRGDRGVADIGVDLGEEIAADDHRLEFAVVDVAGDDRAAARDLAAHEFRGDEGGQVGAKAFAVGQRGLGALQLNLAAEIFAGGDVDHLLGDDAGAGEFQLRDHVVARAAQRLVMRLEGGGGLVAGDVAVIDRFYIAALIFLDAAALLHPCDAGAGEAGVDVDGHRRIGIGTGGVIHRQVRLAGAFAQHDLAQRHANIRRLIGRDKNLARRRQRAGGDGGFQLGGVDGLIHGGAPFRR